MRIQRVGVVGGGAWGTALAQTMALSGRDVVVWANEPETAADINAHRVNSKFLAGIALDRRITATETLSDVSDTDIILAVPPAQFLRPIGAALSPHIRSGQPVIICSKGIEQATGRLMCEVAADVMPTATLAVLSGPSFASDVARGLPAALTLACAREDLGQRLAEALSYHQLRLYWSDDVIGAQLGGAIKNVLAIAAGVIDGKALGASAHAALVTRGFREMTRYAVKAGARPETLAGLSGLGDLVLTCGSPQSRNMSLGRALGRGEALDAILAKRTTVTEGVYTAAGICRLAAAQNVDMPIAKAVLAIVTGAETVDNAISALMSRPIKSEVA